MVRVTRGVGLGLLGWGVLLCWGNQPFMAYVGGVLVGLGMACLWAR